jgi:hypothetical protein
MLAAQSGLDAWTNYYMNTPTVDECMEGGCIRAGTQRSTKILSVRYQNYKEHRGSTSQPNGDGL